ncbi:MAG TPA: hypothetical protein VFQ58_00710, partial [Flavisolibacter sp.]|nr:hypothetical protein [Flavisolibacter sp.]
MPLFSKAQEIPEALKFNLEANAQISGNDYTGIEELHEDLRYYKKHPLELNTSTAGELRQLHLLTDLQIDEFIRYRKLLGKLISIYELQTIPAWDLITISNILPYIKISVKEDLTFFTNANIDQSLKFELYRTIEKSKGYDTSVTNHFLGTPYRYVINYSARINSLFEVGLSAAKDPGEQFFKGAQSMGFDYYSFRIFLRKRGIIKNLAIGDYTVSMGQGLLYWQSLSFGKGSDITGIKKQGEIISPYRSFNEFNFKRGAAITITKGKIDITAFVSYKSINAHLSTDSSDLFTSLNTSGLHRNRTEINEKNTVGDFSGGSNITYNNHYFSVGLNTALDMFSKSFHKKDVPYNLYAFAGNRLLNSSLSYSYTYRNMHLFGEAAFDQHIHSGFIQGVLISLNKIMDMSLLYRNIQASYESLFGKAFTINSLPINEKGLYAGIVLKPSSSLKLTASFDFYSFPWLRYLINGPTNGHNYFIQLMYVPDKKTELLLYYKVQDLAEDTKDSIINYPVLIPKKDMQLRVKKEITGRLSLRSLVQVQIVNNNEGYLYCLESRYKVIKNWIMEARIQYFENNLTNNKLYTYVNNQGYNGYLNGFSGQGYYWNLNTAVSINKSIEIRAQLSQTFYLNQTT